MTEDPGEEDPTDELTEGAPVSPGCRAEPVKSGREKPDNEHAVRHGEGRLARDV